MPTRYPRAHDHHHYRSPPAGPPPPPPRAGAVAASTGGSRRDVHLLLPPDGSPPPPPPHAARRGSPRGRPVAGRGRAGGTIPAGSLLVPTPATVGRISPPPHLLLPHRGSRWSLTAGTRPPRPRAPRLLLLLLPLPASWPPPRAPAALPAGPTRGRGRNAQAKPLFCGSVRVKALRRVRFTGLWLRSRGQNTRLGGLYLELLVEPEPEPSQRGTERSKAAHLSPVIRVYPQSIDRPRLQAKRACEVRSYERESTCHAAMPKHSSVPVRRDVAVERGLLGPHTPPGSTRAHAPVCPGDTLAPVSPPLPRTHPADKNF
jgi:hypothetical protein